MIRKILGTGLVVLLTVALLTVSGCSKRGLEDYEEAVALMETVDSGVEAMDATLHYSFDKEGLSEADVKALEQFEDLSFQMTRTFNKSQDRYAIDGYLSLGGLGFDGALYKNDAGHFIFLPMVNRYVHLEEMLASELVVGQDLSQLSEPPFSEDTLVALQAIWENLLEEENVFKGRPVLMQTGEGELKATVFEITLTPIQIETGLKQVMELLKEDEQWLKFLKAQMASSESDVDLETLFSQEPWKADSQSDVGFKYTAYVDRDGYIIKEQVAVDVLIKDESSSLRGITFAMESAMEQKNKVDQIEMPTFTQDNTLRPETLKSWMDSGQK